MTRNPREILTRSARPPDLDLSYGPDLDHHGEVWWPPAGGREPAPALVVLVHGGFWLAEWDCTHARPLAEALADQGFVVCSLEYRRLGSPGGGGWPDTFDDVATALDHLPEMITASEPFAPAHRIVLVGHSAGGHLALWLAGRHRLPDDHPWHGGTRVHGVVALAPVALLAQADRDDTGEGSVAALVGGHADEISDRYDLVDPSAMVPIGVPTVLVHGALDQQVPIAQSRSFVDLAKGSRRRFGAYRAPRD